VADNQSQWPAQYPRYSQPDGSPVPPPGYQVPANGYQVPPTPYQMPPGYPAQQAGYQVRMDPSMRAASADRTYGELAALTADLPAGPLPVWPVAAYPPTGTNSMAVASMVLGVAEFFTMGLTAIPAVICGHIARRQMRMTQQRGEGLATSGLVLGYMAIIFWAVLIAASLVGVAISIAHNGQGGGPGPGGG
jgi:hypothetical protein